LKNCTSVNFSFFFCWFLNRFYYFFISIFCNTILDGQVFISFFLKEPWRRTQMSFLFQKFYFSDFFFWMSFIYFLFGCKKNWVDFCVFKREREKRSHSTSKKEFSLTNKLFSHIGRYLIKMTNLNWKLLFTSEKVFYPEFILWYDLRF